MITNKIIFDKQKKKTIWINQFSKDLDKIEVMCLILRCLWLLAIEEIYGPETATGGVNNNTILVSVMHPKPNAIPSLSKDIFYLIPTIPSFQKLSKKVPLLSTKKRLCTYGRLNSNNCNPIYKLCCEKNSAKPITNEMVNTMTKH